MPLATIAGPERFPDGRMLVKVRCDVCGDEYWTEPGREVCVWQERADQGKWTLPGHRRITIDT